MSARYRDLLDGWAAKRGKGPIGFAAYVVPQRPPSVSATTAPGPGETSMTAPAPKRTAADEMRALRVRRMESRSKPKKK